MNVSEVGAWLSSSAKFARHAQVFVDNEVDGRVLRALSDEDFDSLNVSLAARYALRDSIRELNNWPYLRYPPSLDRCSSFNQFGPAVEAAMAVALSECGTGSPTATADLGHIFAAAEAAARQHKTAISLDFILDSITSIDEATFMFSASFWIVMVWKDDRVQYLPELTPSELAECGSICNDITALQPSSRCCDNIWTPNYECGVSHSIDVDSGLFVDFSGDFAITQFKKISATYSNSMKLKDFPYDSQHLNISCTSAAPVAAAIQYDTCGLMFKPGFIVPIPSKFADLIVRIFIPILCF
jgi:hypothetical protein